MEGQRTGSSTHPSNNQKKWMPLWESVRVLGWFIFNQSKA
jgi:hypothetical protein